MKNKDNLDPKKEKKVNKIKEQLARLREKLASENKNPSFPSKSKFKKTEDKAKQAEAPKEAKEKKAIRKEDPKKKAKEVKEKKAIRKEDPKKEAREKKAIRKEDPKKEAREKKAIRKEEVKKKAKEAKEKKAIRKEEVKKKAKEAKEKKAIRKEEVKKKAKEAKEKKVRRKEEVKKRAEEAKEKKEEAKKKEEEAKKKEEEAKRTYEDELEEQLTEEEITGFQLEKTDMDKMCNRVCENIAGYESDGILQSQLWKKFKLSSRDGSRLALKLERMGMITREKILEKERWTYKLIIKKTPVSTKSIEGAPCLTCPVEAKCSLDGEVSPKTCQWIENWVMIELKNK